MKRSLTIMAVLLATAALHATTYHLDNTAAGPTFDGSETNPWKTVIQAQTALNALADKGSGDTVLVAEGSGSYGSWADGTTYNDSDFDPVQWTGQARTDWLVIKAADMQNPPEFYHLQAYGGSRDAYIEFNGLKVISRRPHRFDVVVLVRKEMAHVRLLNLYISAENDSSSLPGGIYLWDKPTDVLVEGCVVCTVGAAIQGAGHNTLIRNNEIRYCASSGVKTSSGAGEHVTVEYNYIHHQEKRTERSRLYGTLSGTFTKGDSVVQAVTGARGVVYSIHADNLQVVPDNKVVPGFVAGQDVTSIVNGATVTGIGEVRVGDSTHGSGLSIRNRDGYIARGNIIDHYGSTAPINVYPGAPTGNMLIENNLVSNSNSVANIAMGFGDISTGCVVRNNTFDGSFSPKYHADFEAGVGLSVYNNIILNFTFYHDSSRTLINEGNNIIDNVVVRYGADRNQPHITPTSSSIILQTTQSGTYFENSLFEDYTGNDFRIKASSVAAGFADATQTPATDLNGYDRDGTPDAGCYELGTAVGMTNDELRMTNASVRLPNPLTPSQVRALPGSVYRLNGALPAVLSGGVYLWHDGTQLRKILIKE